MASSNSAEIHPALAEALRADREALNQRFAMRQRAGARIDETAFQEHLRTAVNELIGGVASVQPQGVRAVVRALFDVSLDLLAAGLLGPNTKHPHVSAAWREVLPAAARLLAREPARVAGAVSNAADHLAGHPAARPAEWIAGMRKLAAHAESVAQWLDAGKVLAWRAGLVQYRAAALQIARALPWQLAARCFDMPDNATEPDWQKQLERMQADRWYSPVAADTTARLRIVRTTGGFRGFGGLCLRPPTVTANDAGLFVTDGVDTWQLLADVFGTLWHPVPSDVARPSGVRSQITLDARGKIAWKGTNQIMELAEASSYACDGRTLAVTLPTSYHVFLVAPAR